MADKPTHWRKSTFSGATEDCVELAWAGAEAGIRDSKAPDTAPLTLPAPAFHHLLTHAKHS
jgi:Domain of unknown function (DUF397)